jgi:flavin reductase (DIM6/NTAB) family NADH-FMN oxidoreductase RutF
VCQKEEKFYSDHTLLVGQVVLMEVEEKVICKDSTINTDNISPLLYLGIDNYISINYSSRISLKEIPFHYKGK